jgi:gamma-glutamyltranspeptidase / glutathione hydrolase
MRKCLLLLLCLAILTTLLIQPAPSLAQSQLPVKYCNENPKPAWCSAVRGDRPSGWLPQGRSEVMARNGIVATSQPLAAQAGLRILMAGGNAIDAAVATAAVLNLVEPMNVGIGGDLFAIIYSAKDKKVYQLNAGGMAPTGATVAYYNSLGWFWDPKNWGFGSGMSSNGILAAPVPSAAWGWDDAVRKFGKLSLKEIMQPAIEYAEKGFPVSEVIGNGASGWSLPKAVNSSGMTPCGKTGAPCDIPDPDAVAAWYVDDGNGGKRGPKAGEIFKNQDLAKTFRLFAEHGRDVFYKGEIAHAIVKKSKELGGTMTLDDLRHYYGEWVEAPHTNYHGYDVYEAMAPSQAWNTLEILNILEVCVPQWIPGKTLADLGPANPQYWHLMVEAKKLAYIDLYGYNSDPRFWTASQKQLFRKILSKEYAATLCGKVNPNGPAFTPGPAPYPAEASADTIYLTTADRWGNMVSWVNSNYTGFGTGVGIPGYGFVLNSRLAQFTLDPNHPNKIEPHKRPYDTISCGFLAAPDGKLMTLGLMGGDMQAQGHAQVLVNMIDLGANLQAATDMARFRHNEVPNELSLESELFKLVGTQLKAMGHTVGSVNGSAVGGYQTIMFVPDSEEAAPTRYGHDRWFWPVWGHEHEGIPGADVKPIDGFYRAGSDHRKDGGAVGW